MFSFTQIDESYPQRAQKNEKPATSSSAATTTVRASREHAAIAPRYLGLRIVIAKSFARIHWQNLANYGVSALEFVNAEDYDAIDQTTRSAYGRKTLPDKTTLEVENSTKEKSFTVRHRLSPRQVEDVLAGGLIARLAEDED